MEFNKFFQSAIFKKTLLALGAVIVLLGVFKLGILVGYKKAGFSYKWGEQYHRNFGGPRGGFFGNIRRGFGDKDFINAHGTFGSIIRLDSTTSTALSILVIKGKDDLEKTILVSDKTEIGSRRQAITIGDLKIDDQVVVIGSPNEQGQIEAKLIRLFR